jgi:hypothetical protein
MGSLPWCFISRLCVVCDPQIHFVYPRASIQQGQHQQTKNVMVCTLHSHHLLRSWNTIAYGIDDAKVAYSLLETENAFAMSCLVQTTEDIVGPHHRTRYQSSSTIQIGFCSLFDNIMFAIYFTYNCKTLQLSTSNAKS